MSNNRKVISSINDYPEHLNPFYEDDHHNRLRFWDRGKNFIRRSSFSFSDIKTLPRRLSFRSKNKKDSEDLQNLRRKYQSNSTELQRKVYPDSKNNYATNDFQIRKTNTLLPGSSLRNVQVRVNDIPNKEDDPPSRPSTSLGFSSTESNSHLLVRKKRRAPPPPSIDVSISRDVNHSLENKQECQSKNPFDDEEDVVIDESKPMVEIYVKPTPPRRTKLKEDEQKHEKEELVEGNFKYKNEMTLNLSDDIKIDQVDKTNTENEIEGDNRTDKGVDGGKKENIDKEKDINVEENNENITNVDKEDTNIDEEKDMNIDKEKDISINDENIVEIREDKTIVTQRKIVKMDIDLTTERNNKVEENDSNNEISNNKIDKPEIVITDVDITKINEDKNTTSESNKNIIEESKMEILKYIDIITERIDRNGTNEIGESETLNNQSQNDDMVYSDVIKTPETNNKDTKKVNVDDKINSNKDSTLETTNKKITDDKLDISKESQIIGEILDINQKTLDIKNDINLNKEVVDRNSESLDINSEIIDEKTKENDVKENFTKENNFRKESSVTKEKDITIDTNVTKENNVTKVNNVVKEYNVNKDDVTEDNNITKDNNVIEDSNVTEDNITIKNFENFEYLLLEEEDDEQTDFNFNTKSNEPNHLEDEINHEDVINDPDKLLAMVQKLQEEVQQMTFNFDKIDEFDSTNSKQK